MVTWIPAALALMLLCLASLRRPLSPRTIRWFVRSADLPSASEDSRLVARLELREAAVAKTALAASAAVSVAGLSVPALRAAPVWGMAVVAAFLLGRATGSVAFDLKTARTPLPVDSPRVARPVIPSIGDHVLRAERAATAVAAVLPTALVGGIVAAAAADRIDSGRVGWGGLIGLSLIALCLLAGTELLAARLVDAPRPSATPSHLAQDDALRAQSLRALYHSTTSLGFAAGLSVLLLVEPALRGHWPQDPLQGVWNGAVVACAVLMVGFMGAAAFSMPGARFRRRLWPQPDTPRPGRPGKS